MKKILAQLLCWYCHQPIRFEKQRCPACGELN